MMELDVAADAESTSNRAAAWLGERIREAIDARGAAHVAVSGGSTPVAMFEALAGASDVDWTAVNLYQVDERVAPDGDDARNATSLAAALVDRVPIPAGHVHLMDVTTGDLAAAAGRYAAVVAAVTFDVVHLGLGGDGHTASWPPGDRVVRSTDVEAVVVGPFNGHRRMTLTPTPVNRARTRLWLVTEATKAPMLRRLLDADPTIPASHVSPTKSIVFTDEATAGG